jgi:beta-phosphoglucomutase
LHAHEAAAVHDIVQLLSHDERGWIFSRAAARGRETIDETLFALSDGTLGVRGGLEERASNTDGAFLTAGFVEHELRYHERFAGFASSTDVRVPIADGKRIRISLGEKREDIASTCSEETQRTLDLRTGRLQRTTLWVAANGNALTVNAERIVSLSRPGLLAVRLSIKSAGLTGPMHIESWIDVTGAVARQGTDPRIGTNAPGLSLVAQGVKDDHSFVVQRGARPIVCVVAHDRAFENIEGSGLRSQQLTLESGVELVIEKFVAYAWSDVSAADENTLVGEAREKADAARAVGFAALCREQSEQLERFWNVAHVDIDGADDLLLPLRLNLFHLFQAVGTSGNPVVGAKGLTGQGYEGHVFWDTDVYVVPLMALWMPERARALLMYRKQRLEAARQHARELNHARGALYPWRTIAGGECSAYFPSGSAQYHINAAVAYSIECYWLATRDVSFLIEAGAEILFETARFWLDVGHFNPRRDGAFCIHAVTGPDEYSAIVDNDYYTNLMAQRHLRFAAQVYDLLAFERREALAALTATLSIEAAEVAEWRLAAARMYLPYDARLGVHPQDDTFLDKPFLPPALAGASHPLLLALHPLTLYRHQVCKQASVVLALLLAGERIPLEHKRRDLDYYEHITTHDSTLSPGPHAVLAAEVGNDRQALEFLRKTVLMDHDNLHGNTHHGAHMAAMAGAWSALVAGFGGMRCTQEGLSFRPKLPPRWNSWHATLCWRSATLAIRVGARTACYRHLAGPAVQFRHDEREVCLAPGASVELAWGVHAGWAAVIFDLDGVLTDTAELHYRAWQRLADEIGVAFDRYANELLKGVDRMGSLERILASSQLHWSDAQKHELAERKNSYYLHELETLDETMLLAGAREVLQACRAAGMKVGLASASRNAPLILQRLNIAAWFDVVADPARVPRGKPHPDLFLAAADALGVHPARCIGVEDSVAGIEAILAAGMTAIGVGDTATLARADRVIASLTDLQACIHLGGAAQAAR